MSNIDLVEVELSFTRNDLLKVDGDARGLQIVCKRGKFWITQANDEEDHTLQTNELFAITGPKSVLIQSLTDGLVQVVTRSALWVNSPQKASHPNHLRCLYVSNLFIFRSFCVISQ